jgi:hypothetical protein
VRLSFKKKKREFNRVHQREQFRRRCVFVQETREKEEPKKWQSSNQRLYIQGEECAWEIRRERERAERVCKREREGVQEREGMQERERERARARAGIERQKRVCKRERFSRKTRNHTPFLVGQRNHRVGKGAFLMRNGNHAI